MAPLEDIAAEVPERLAHADELLTRYGRWAVQSGRGGTPYTVDRQYIREADRRESLEAYQRRRESALRDMLLTVADAMRVQRALAKVPDRERIVLAVLYVPRKVPPREQLRILRIPPRLSRERHLEGLREFSRLYELASGWSAELMRP